MASKGKRTKVGGGLREGPTPVLEKARHKGATRTARAGLRMPVALTTRRMRGYDVAARVASQAAVALTAALEYVAAEILSLASDEAHGRKRKTIKTRDLAMAVKKDPEMASLLGRVGVEFNSGVQTPYLNDAARRKQARKQKRRAAAEQEAGEE